MNKEIAKKWIAALRSGKYKQTQRRLRFGDSFCCLGVLCNLHAKAHPEYAAKQTDPRAYGREFLVLPGVVTHWAALKTDNGSLGNGSSLAGLNDEGKQFPSIADAIEKHVEAL